MEQDEAVGGEDLADLEAGAVQRSSGEEVRGAVRPAELPRLGGAAPAGGPSGGEEQSRRVQAGRSRAGTGAAASAVGDEELPGGESRPSFSVLLSPLSFRLDLGRPICFSAGNRARSRRPICFRAGNRGNRHRFRLGAASRASAPPPLRLIAASRRLAPPRAQTAAFHPRPGDGRRLATNRAWAPSNRRLAEQGIHFNNLVT